MKMIRKKVNIQTIFLFLTLIGLACAQQNLCGPQRINPQFTQDFSACRSYLFCNYNETGLVSVHQLMCPDNHVFNEPLQACDGTGATPCVEGPQCPPGRTIMIANPTDPMCMGFHLCLNGELVLNAGTCPFSSVFNRNFGTCTPSVIAPCIGIVDGYCPPHFTGLVPVWGSCSRHGFCRNGVLEAFLECPPGLHFNPMTRACDNPAFVQPPCPFA